MRRQNESAIDVLFDVLTMVPAWVGPVLAAVAYLFVRYLIPHMLSSSQGDPRIGATFNDLIASGARVVAPYVSVGILLLWLVAEIKKWADRRRLDRTEDLEDVRHISWRDFEALVGEMYRRQGYTVEETGSASGDGGVDLVLHRNRERTLVQCKHWRARQVGVKVLRELQGVLADNGADHGVIVSYGNFTDEARAFADRNGIDLVGGSELERMIAEVKGSLPERSSAPVSTKPSCPTCGGTMSRKVSRKGRYAGKPFWSCDRFPDCHGLIPIQTSSKSA